MLRSREGRRTKYIFCKLTNLVYLYRERLVQLGASITERINSTRLKERLLKHIPDMKAYTIGTLYWLLMKISLNPMIQQICSTTTVITYFWRKLPSVYDRACLTVINSLKDLLPLTATRMLFLLTYQLYSEWYQMVLN